MIIQKFHEISFKAQREIITQKHELNYLFWECTLRCNLGCLHCGSDCLKTSGTQDMPLNDFIGVLDDIKAKNTSPWLMVAITGGEPLLRKDLETAGKEIIKRGFGWGIVTNGLLMTEDRFNSLIAAGLGSVSYSFDGLEKEHNFLRQNPASFNAVDNAVKITCSYIKNHPHTLNFDVITTVHPENINHLDEIRDYLISLGVTKWRMFSVFPSGRGCTNQQELTLSKEQYRQMMDFIARTRKDYGDKLHLSYACEGYLGEYECKVRDTPFFCRGGINIGSVMCDGSISACLSVRGRDFIQGNIYKDSFMDVWNSRFGVMRNRTWARKGKCAKCKKWSLCLGNGLHLYSSMKDEPAHCNYELLK